MINYLEDAAATFHDKLATEIEKESKRIIENEWRGKSQIEEIEYYDFVTDWKVCEGKLEVTVTTTYKVLYFWDSDKEDNDYIIKLTSTNFDIETLANESTQQLGAFIQSNSISTHDPRKEYHKEAHL